MEDTKNLYRHCINIMEEAIKGVRNGGVEFLMRIQMALMILVALTIGGQRREVIAMISISNTVKNEKGQYEINLEGEKVVRRSGKSLKKNFFLNSFLLF